MRLRHGLVLLAATTVLGGCGGESSASGDLETDEQKASYAIGADIGRSLAPAGEKFDTDAFLKGIEDGRAGRESALPQEELQAAMQRFSQSLQEEQQKTQAGLAEKSRKEGADYLAANGKKEGVTTTASGLQYEVLTAGSGARPTTADQVTIHYRGTLVDGTEFDSSYGRGEPATFPVSGVIKGFTEGLLLMPIGSKYRLVIPSELGYGPEGSGPGIPPDATLVFEVELISIN